MKQTRRRRHLRPRATRSQVNNNIRRYELALRVLRVEAAFELSRPEPNTQRLLWMEDRANKCLDAISALVKY
jgi:hypothetical protein